VFEHVLIRDVAYRTILRPLRAEKHRRAAEWLSSLTGDRRDRADKIAYHYVAALENAEASGGGTAELRLATSEALQAAAERARSLNSHAAAARLYGQALELRAPGDDRRPSLLLAYGTALAMADEPAAQALEEAAGALIAAGDLSGAAEVESTSGWLLSVAGKPDQARERDERALELVRDTAPSHAKALILTRAGAHMVFVDGRREEAIRLLQEALSIAELLGLREMEAEALQFVGMARLDAGDEGGVQDIEKALAAATELNSPVSLSCYGNLSDMRRYLGDLRESAALHLEGERAADRFGIPVQLRRFRAEQACDLYYSGNWDDALEHIEEYLDSVQTGSPHRGVGEARIHRGRIRLARGDGLGAREDAEAALEFARATAEPFNIFPALAFHARAWREHEPDRAHASAAELIDGLAAGQPFWGAWSLPDLLAGLTDGRRLGELRNLLRVAKPRTGWYGAASAVIDGDFARAADLYAAMGSKPDEAVAGLRAAERSVTVGNDVRAQDHLARSLAFFSRVGAQTYMRDAETLVSR
jgi:tetratricopeptide (TPR) repeat protein